MADRLQRLLDNERLIYTLVLVLALAGIAAYLSMIRQEDPAFPYRAGLITVVFPGADPARVESLILQPLEEELAGIEEVDHTQGTARQGVAIVRVVLLPSVYDTDTAWDRVRVAMDDAAREFPDGVHKPDLDDRIVTASTAVLAITGSDDPLVLADAAERLKPHLLDLPNTASVRLVGDPGEQITVALSDAALARTGLTPGQLIAQLDAGNQIIAGGSLAMGDRSLVLRPRTDYRSIEEIRATPIQLPGGGVVPLGSFAEIARSEAQPPTERVWYDGQRTVALDVLSQRDATHVVNYGKRLRATIDDLRDEFAPLEIHEMSYQPAYTENRLADLTRSLFYAVLIIVAVLFIGMGLRVGLLVATVLPLVTLAALAVYAMGGGVLHQMAIIGLVIALGILVDNAIVMTENIQHHLNVGASRAQAAASSVRELAAPLFAATGTTLAAFAPLLLSKGDTADFTRAIPIMIMLALIISYIFAVTFTPIVARRFLKPQGRGRETNAPVIRLAERLGAVSTEHPWRMVGVGGLILLFAFASASFLDQEFFPNADRDQVVIDLSMPEGTHLEATQKVAARMERALRRRPEVGAVHGFVGFSGPSFYYNLIRNPREPHRARLIAETGNLADNRAVIEWVRGFAREELPGVQVVPTILRQGPPVSAPIEVRIFNPDPERLATATERIFAAALAVPGARDVRQDLGTGAPSVVYEIHDAAARRLGVTREDVAQALLGRTHGILLGQYRAGEDPVPIRIRSPQGEYFPLPELQTVNVYGDTGEPIPLAQVASATLEMQPAAISHYNQHRVARVSAELGDGFVYSEVLEPIREAISGLDLPSGTRIEYGGEAEASAEANTALIQAAPLGVGLLLFFLLMEFNSFRRLGLVLLTIPFAVAGVIPGLLLLGIPFGFQPLQGIIALVGIVVNNAIVLIDVIDRRLGEGENIVQAVRDAVRRRTRPILLTTATTIAGLLPLAVSDTTLWPPMAWTIITGLLASTVLTLLVLPALCRLLLGRGRMPAVPAMTGIVVAAILVGGVLPVTPLRAEEPSTVDFMSAAVLGARQPDSQVRVFEARAAAADAAAERRLGRYPVLEVEAFASRSDQVGEIEIPSLGPNIPAQSFPAGTREQAGAIVELRQPLIHPARQFFTAPAAEYAAAAAESQAASTKLANAIDAVEIYFDALDLRARLEANRSLRRSLTAREARVEKLLAHGRALVSDRAELRFARQQAEQAGVRLRENYRLAQARLARAIGRDGRTEPAPLDFQARPVTRPVPVLLAKALDVRRDLQALDLRIRELELRVGEVGAQRLPKLDAVASLRYNEGNAFAPESEGRIEAQVTWTPFAGGAIGARKAAVRAELSAMRARRLSFSRAVRVQIEQTLAELETAIALEELAAVGVESALATRDARGARYEAGRATLDQVLEAEANLAEQQAQAAIARHDRVRAWVRLQGTLGNSKWIDATVVDGPVESGSNTSVNGKVLSSRSGVK